MLRRATSLVLMFAIAVSITHYLEWHPEAVGLESISLKSLGELAFVALKSLVVLVLPLGVLAFIFTAVRRLVRWMVVLSLVCTLVCTLVGVFFIQQIWAALHWKVLLFLATLGALAPLNLIINLRATFDRFSSWWKKRQQTTTPTSAS